MALVRRTVAVGRAHVPGTATAVPQQPGAPQQAGAAAPGSPYPPTAGPVSPGPSAPPAPGPEQAAAVASMPAKGWATVTGLGLAAVGAVGAYNIDFFAGHTPFPIGDETSTFGALFVFSAAVERILEPFSRFMPGGTQQARYEKAVADMDNGVPGAMNAAAYYKAAVDSARSSRGILMWGLATCAATLLSAGSGFCLLRLLSSDPGWNGVAYWVDALVTGLIVGSGTKPLHDLLNKVQKQSNTTQTPI